MVAALKVHIAGVQRPHRVDVADRSSVTGRDCLQVGDLLEGCAGGGHGRRRRRAPDLDRGRGG